MSSGSNDTSSSHYKREGKVVGSKPIGWVYKLPIKKVLPQPLLRTLLLSLCLGLAMWKILSSCLININEQFGKDFVFSFTLHNLLYERPLTRAGHFYPFFPLFLLHDWQINVIIASFCCFLEYCAINFFHFSSPLLFPLQKMTSFL